MDKTIRKNYYYNLAYQIVAILAPLITAPYISRALGVLGVGDYSFTFANASYFVILANLGTATFAQREVALYKDDKTAVSKIFWQVLILRVIYGCVAIGLYFIVFCTLDSLSLLAIVQSLNILCVAFDISWLYQGLEQFQKTSVRSFTIKLIFILYVFIFVHNETDLIIYAFGYGFITLVSNAVLWIGIKKYIIRIPISKLKIWVYVWPSFLLFIPTVANQIYTVLDKTMIGLFTDSSLQNGIYEQAEKISKMALTIYTSLGIVVAPRISYLYGKKEMGEVKKLLNESMTFMWFLIIPMCAGLFGISSNLVPWFYGEDFSGAIPILRIFSFLLLPVGLSNITAVQCLIPIKKQNLFTISVVVGAAVNLILNLFLIPRFYAAGAAIASVVAESVITLIQVYFVVFKLKIFTLNTIYQTSKRYLVCSLIMILPVYFLSNILTPSIIHSFELITIGVVMYGILLVIFKDKYMMMIINKFVKKN